MARTKTKKKRREPSRREGLLALALLLVGRVILKIADLRADALAAAEAGSSMGQWAREITRGEMLLLELSKTRRVNQLLPAIDATMRWLDAKQPRLPIARSLH